MNRKIWMVAALCLFPLAGAVAQNYELGDLAPGEVMMNLSATERTEVAQDTLIANLQYTVENSDRATVQREINSAMTQAIELARGVESVQHSTDGYHVYLYNTPPPRAQEGDDDAQTPSVWRGQQSLTLKSKDSAALLDLAGKLQAMDLNMAGLYYTLSPERHEEVSDGLMEAALNKLQARADAAGRALGKSSATLVRIDLGGQGMQRAQSVMMRGAALDMAEAMPAPVAVPGQTEVLMAVSATALLKP